MKKNNEVEQLKEALAKTNKPFLNEIKKVTALLKEGFLDNANSSAKRLPERVFVEHFLPRFAGRPELETVPWIRDWVSIAGSAMAEVVIVDNANNELFAVPPIMDTSFISVAPKDFFGPTLGNVVQRSLQISANTPTQGEQFLNENLVKKLDDMVDVSENKRPVNEQRWLAIFDRYGIKIKTEEEIKKKIPDDNLSGMFDYS